MAGLVHKQCESYRIEMESRTDVVLALTAAVEMDAALLHLS